MCLHVSRYVFFIHLSSSAVMYRTKNSISGKKTRLICAADFFSLLFVSHVPNIFCTFWMFSNLPSKLEKSELQSTGFIYEAHKEMGKTKYNWAVQNLNLGTNNTIWFIFHYNSDRTEKTQKKCNNLVWGDDPDQVAVLWLRVWPFVVLGQSFPSHSDMMLLGSDHRNPPGRVYNLLPESPILVLSRNGLHLGVLPSIGSDGLLKMCFILINLTLCLRLGTSFLQGIDSSRGPGHKK